MPRIDPLQLLRCLSVLLSPVGGIKSNDEVQRLASLMTKFSKKLVSKCIYVQILKTTETELLGSFMGSGGWHLAHQWLSDAILAQNLPFITELLELLLMCPVDVLCLKSNSCPKLIKNLTKEATSEHVRQLATRLVEQWLRIVKGQAAEPELSTQFVAESIELTLPCASENSSAMSHCEEQLAPVEEPVAPSETVVDEELVEESVVVLEAPTEINGDKVDGEEDTKAIDDKSLPVGKLPVYKITIRDGVNVLAKVNSSDRPPRKQTFDSASIKQDIPKVTTSIVVKRTIDSVDKKKGDDLNSGLDKVKSSTSVKTKSVKSDNHMDVKQIAKGIQKKLLQKSLTEKKMKLIEPSKDKPSEASTEKERTKERKEKEFNIKLKEKKLEKANAIAEKAAAQVEKDKATLAKLVPPPISKLGKIPKKPRMDDDSKPGDGKKSSSDDKKSSEHKRSPLSPDIKKTSSSSDSRKSSSSTHGRPKTVKSFNSKFRSTGLEEQIKPPASVKSSRRSSSSSSSDHKKSSSKTDLKRTSPPPKDAVPPEKKLKTSVPEVPVEEPKKIEKPPPAKPKRIVLQESDMFMDALTASTKKEVRKRKRPASISKEGDVKKEPVSKDDTPPASPTSEDNLSPVIKAAPRFYRDTLDDEEKDEPKESKVSAKKEKINSEDTENSTETQGAREESAEPGDEDKTKTAEKEEESEVTDESAVKTPRGVLVYHKTRKGPKKTVRWKAEKELENIKFFELDETERVNVTKTFTDMKQMEHTSEREGFVLTRKIAQEDNMEEKTVWKTPALLELPKDFAEWGVNSQEKDIQYARESVVLSALYFNRASIPDSASEPDSESHPAKDPVLIPLDDPSGSQDNIIDFRGKPWPEPKPLLQPTSPTPNVFPQNPPAFQVYSGISTSFSNAPPMFPPNNIAPPMMQQNGIGPSTGGDWRTGDGRIVSMDNMPMDMYNQQGGPAMGMSMPGMVGPGPGGPMDMNYNMMQNEDMSQYPMQGFPMHGPPMQGPPMQGPPMQGPPMQGPPMFPQFHGGRGPMGPRGNRNAGPGPRGQQQWFRPNGGPPNGAWQGRGGARPWGRGICHQFANRGTCRQGTKCLYTH